MIYLTLINISVVMSVAGAFSYIFYNVSFGEQERRLVETAQMHAEMVGAMVRYDAGCASQLQDAHENYEKYAADEEVFIARNVGHLEFVLAQPEEMLLEPMIRGIRGETGTMTVTTQQSASLVAYAPANIKKMENWGVVVKLPLSAIRGSFMDVALWAIPITLILTVSGTLLFLRLVNPVIRRMVRSEDRVDAEKEILESHRAVELANERLERTAGDIKLLMERIAAGETGVRFDNPCLKRCWEANNCALECPAKDAPHLRCWDTAGTCVEATTGDGGVLKRALCSTCSVFLDARADPLCDLGETFNSMMRMLEAAAKEAQIAARAKSEFLANMSHEIRTPLTAILGFAEMLELDGDMKAAPQSRVDAVRTIRRNGDHLLQMINDILDLSKMDAGMVEIATEPCNLPSIVDGIMGSFRALAKPGVELETDCPSATIKSSPIRLRQMLLNLVGNAVKFTESGSVKVTVAIVRGQMTIDVKDTGPGMKWEQAKGLFTPFHQLDNSATRQYGGTGLGLAITHRLAHIMGGEVDIVQAEPNVGCTFQVSLPVTVIKQSMCDVETATTKKMPHGLRCLVVEDSKDNREFFTSLLNSLGSKVSTAFNGEQSVELVAGGEEYDVILMDMQMPVMDGWTATRLLRESGCVIPIVAVTASAMDGDDAKCISAGCDSYVSKPVSTKSLSAAIAKAMQHAERTESLAAALC